MYLLIGVVAGWWSLSFVVGDVVRFYGPSALLDMVDIHSDIMLGPAYKLVCMILVYADAT